MKKKRLLIILIVILSAFNLCCSRTKPQKIVRITVNSWVGFGPLFVASAFGLFEKNGLKVDIFKLENAPDRRAALISRRVDIVGSTLDDLVVSVSQGVDSAAFACADYSNGGDGIIATKDIDSLEKLIKNRIAVQPGFVNHFFLLYVLDRNGISTNNLLLNPMTPDDAGAAFIARSIDVAVTWEPFLSEGLNKRPGAILLASSKDYPEAIIDVFIAQRTWISENMNLVNDFRKTWDDSLSFIENNKDAAYLTISKEIGVSQKEVEAMLDKVKLLKNIEFYNFLSRKLPILSESINRLWKQAGYISNDVNLTNRIIFPER